MRTTSTLISGQVSGLYGCKARSILGCENYPMYFHCQCVLIKSENFVSRYSVSVIETKLAELK